MSKKKNICNIIIPLAGKGQRMIAAGYNQPKAMIDVMGRSILEWSMDSIDVGGNNLVFIVRGDHIRSHNLDLWLLSKWPQAKIVKLDCETQGSMHSCLFADKVVDLDKPLVVYCPDIWFRPKFRPNEGDFYHSGKILTFKANSKNYSYIERHSNCDFVYRTREKEVISNEASVGVYCFKSTSGWFELARKIYGDGTGRGELYICPMYNELIADNYSVEAQPIDKIYIMGTPEEKRCFERYIYRFMHPEKGFTLSCDHSGFETKQEILKILDEWEVPYHDAGAFDDKDCDYNLPVNAACRRVLNTPNYLGIGCCRTGQGINVCANKIEGIRSALVYNQYTAEYAIRHNAANFFALPNLDKRKLPGILEKLLTATFDGGRHQNRIMLCEE